MFSVCRVRNNALSPLYSQYRTIRDLKKKLRYADAVYLISTRIYTTDNYVKQKNPYCVCVCVCTLRAHECMDFILK